MTRNAPLFNRRRDDDAMATAFLSAVAGFALPGFAGRTRQPSDPLDGIDVKAEYQLILQKRSRLSASQRAAVVRRALPRIERDMQE
jgi:hypothetical protein